MRSSRCRCSPFGAVPTRSHQGCNALPQNRLQVVAYPCERKSKKSLASETNDPKSLASETNEILSQPHDRIVALANEIVALANEILRLANDPGFLESLQIRSSAVASGCRLPVASCRVPRAPSRRNMLRARASRGSRRSRTPSCRSARTSYPRPAHPRSCSSGTSSAWCLLDLDQDRGRCYSDG